MEGGILELDGELLEAVKLSWRNVGCSSCILTCLQEHLLLTSFGDWFCVLSRYVCFSAFMLAFMVSVKGRFVHMCVVAGKCGQRVVPSREIWKWLSWKGRLLCGNR